MSKIRALVIERHSRPNINPIRPEAAQIVGLHQSGEVEVTVMCNPDSGLVDYYAQYGIEVLTLPLDKKLSWHTIKTIRHTLINRQIQVLHLFANTPVSNGATAAIGLPVKVIAYRGQTGNIRRIDPSSYLSMLHPRIDKIICVAKAVEEDLANHVNNPSKKLATVYKGHDSSWYQNPPADLSQFNLPEDAFKVSLVANLRPRKGLHVLMDATHHLPKDANIHFLLVGANPDNDKIKQMIASSGCPERIHPMGWRTDAPEVAAASDLVVLPTLKREGLCRAVLEANSYGTPAVMSDTGGNAELVKDGHTGFIVPPGDAKALAEAIHRLYQDRDLNDKFGLAAQARVREKFNVEQGVEATLAIYRELALALNQ
ncbi:glycosyltransferase family 4 protein [Ferrimonas sediminicola]|uniref:Glycosyltransferase family 4 protein n=1 Tax=Ferrimonas sediminicola TaxID=2569538 RepID=A0A4U1B9X0_9GAMM|nr:glycosyltransferase [Ferrimonas sediminicola]TKB47592.1 glycosyltransferase family 4 protein [Ferrimonas sediminicola]